MIPALVSIYDRNCLVAYQALLATCIVAVDACELCKPDAVGVAALDDGFDRYFLLILLYLCFNITGSGLLDLDAISVVLLTLVRV